LSIIKGIENDIVAQLQSQLAYLTTAQGGTCRGVADVTTALQLEREIPPAVLVEYAGETADPPLHISGGRQLVRIPWDLFVIAESFSKDGEGRESVYTMLDDISTALGGFVLPSTVSRTMAKLFRRGIKRWSLTDASVIYLSQWYCDVIRG
jgi:hypothetical protein